MIIVSDEGTLIDKDIAIQKFKQLNPVLRAKYGVTDDKVNFIGIEESDGLKFIVKPFGN